MTYTILQEDPKIIKLAQALEGPWFDKHIGWDRLISLRKIRWERLSNSDKSRKIMQAKSLLRTQEYLTNLERNVDAN